MRVSNCLVMNGSCLYVGLECRAYYRILGALWLHIRPWIDLKVDFVVTKNNPPLPPLARFKDIGGYINTENCFFFFFLTRIWDGCLIKNRAWSVEMNAHASSPPSVSSIPNPRPRWNNQFAAVSMFPSVGHWATCSYNCHFTLSCGKPMNYSPWFDLFFGGGG